MKHNFKAAAEFEEKKPDRFAGGWEMDEKEAEEIKMELKDEAINEKHVVIYWAAYCSLTGHAGEIPDQWV